VPKGLVLFSGGLDSILAVRLLQEQGVALAGVHYIHVFTPSGAGDEAKRAAERLGLALHVEDISDQLLRLVERPPHGYGSGANPCIDCRILQFRRAVELMRTTEAGFLVTGEVLGERPMSQRRDAMRLIEKEAGVAGRVVRPLSARLLEETIPEREGWVRRDGLLAISGRSRRPQLELAARYGITEFPGPAGGCLLTDPGFAARMHDLLACQERCTLNDVALLKVGRHFRLDPSTRLVVGRQKMENEAIERLARPGDLLLEAIGYPGPTALMRGANQDGALRAAASITLRYGKAGALPRGTVRVWPAGSDRAEGRTVEVEPARQDLLDRLRIGSSAKRRRG